MASFQLNVRTVTMVRHGLSYPEAYKLSSLRHLGSNLPGDLLMLAVRADYHDALFAELRSSSTLAFP
ncbi:hypothetical protein BU52_10975 [Streptomyces toyocaensis]|uniref:Uncharacterized protein n=1 Tax=Streptomyces toyocaensis TaxID=55952 RepID=A0A081XU82_STRTO|nr:hypothetical protein BU52_10975 [Streptomyces toyocaensis]